MAWSKDNGSQSAVNAAQYIDGKKPLIEQAIIDANEAKPIAASAKAESGQAKVTAGQADTKATDALAKATSAKTTAETVQGEFDRVVAEAGSNNPEVVNARGGEANLKARLDKTTAQLADKAPLSGTIETNVGKPARVYLGVIRNIGAGWYYIEDAVHEKLNFTSLEINETSEIKVNMRAGKKVGSIIAVPDETFAGLGLTCGTSVGVYNTNVRLYAEFSGKIGGDGVINTKDWFNGTYTTTKSADGTQVTVDFDGVDDINLPFSIVPEYEGSAPFDGLEIRAYRVSLKSVIFRAFKDLYGYVSYNGSAWVASSSCVANISAAFNNTTGELTITHDGMSADAGHLAFHSLNIEMRDSAGGLIHARVVSSNWTTIVVKFYDATGNVILTPNTNMRLWFNRPGFKVPHVWVPAAKAYFNMGRTKLRADKVVSVAGNIWLIGANHS